MKHRAFTLILTAALLPACATVTKGTHEEIVVSSEPEGALAVSDMRDRDGRKIQCEPTPCKLNLPRTSGAKITVSKDGYAPISFALASSRATSSTSLKTGTLVAGLPSGSHVIVGTPELLKRVPVSVTAWGNVFSPVPGVGMVIDAATGANKSLSPNPVTIFLAPDTQALAQSQNGAAQ